MMPSTFEWWRAAVTGSQVEKVAMPWVKGSIVHVIHNGSLGIQWFDGSYEIVNPDRRDIRLIERGKHERKFI